MGFIAFSPSYHCVGMGRIRFRDGRKRLAPVPRMLNSASYLESGGSVYRRELIHFGSTDNSFADCIFAKLRQVALNRLFGLRGEVGGHF
jgi:hypothetical protein